MTVILQPYQTTTAEPLSLAPPSFSSHTINLHPLPQKARLQQYHPDPIAAQTRKTQQVATFLPSPRRLSGQLRRTASDWPLKGVNISLPINPTP